VRSSFVLGCCSVLVVSRVIFAKQISRKRLHTQKAFSKCKQKSNAAHADFFYTFGYLLQSEIQPLSSCYPLVTEPCFQWKCFCAFISASNWNSFPSVTWLIFLQSSAGILDKPCIQFKRGLGLWSVFVQTLLHLSGTYRVEQTSLKRSPSQLWKHSFLIVPFF